MPSTDGIKLDVQGAGVLARKLRKLGASTQFIGRAVGGSVYRSFERVMEDSKVTYCPVDTGNLRASGQVTPPTIKGGDVTVSMGYGNTSVSYAVIVHETNKAYRNGKQWKYLETPLLKRINEINQALLDDLNHALDTL